MIRNHAKIWKANRAIWGCNHHSAGIYAGSGGLSFAWCAWCAKGGGGDREIWREQPAKTRRVAEDKEEV